MLVDIVEAPGWSLDSAMRPGRSRVLLHNLDQDVSLADPDYINENWAQRVNAAAQRTGTLWFSLHLGFAAQQVHFKEHMLPDSAPLCRDELKERIVDNVLRAKQALDMPLLLE